MSYYGAQTKNGYLFFNPQAIQVICSLMDCVDKIALITGYYKVYVDNTSETPLPVENDERWPFSFRRDPRANDGMWKRYIV